MMRPLLLLGLLACLGLPAAHAREKKIPRPPGTGILQHVRLVGQDKASPTGGVCLDGSPAGYYFRQGWGNGTNKFLLYYESGGWCSSDRSCNIRAQTPLGSSKEWLPFMEASASLGSYFLNTTNNPLYNWNILFMVRPHSLMAIASISHTPPFLLTRPFIQTRILNACIGLFLLVAPSSNSSLHPFT